MDFYTLSEKQERMLDAINSAATADEHRRLERDRHMWLEGIKDAAGEHVHGALLFVADNYYLDQGIDRPMCCGVWLDWAPADGAAPVSP